MAKTRKYPALDKKGILNIKFEPFGKQLQAYQALQNPTVTEVMYGGGNGGGKTELGCSWLLIQALQYPGTRWLMGRTILDTLKKTTFRSFQDIAKKWNIPYEFNGQSNIITLFNGSEIFLKDLEQYPSDPNFDNFGGYEVTGAFIDEASQVCQAARTIVQLRIRYKLKELGLTPKTLYTTIPNKGWCFDDFYEPWKNGTLDPSRRFIPALAKHNPHLPDSYHTQLDRIVPEALRACLRDGVWEQGMDDYALMTYDAIRAIYSNKGILLRNEANEIVGTWQGLKKNTKSCITMDVAACVGKDNTVIVLWRGFAAIEIHKSNTMDTTEATRFVLELARREGIPMRDIIVDCDGLGISVLDNLKGITKFNNAGKVLHGANYLNLKSQCYFRLAELVCNGQVYVNLPDTNERDLLSKELE